MLKIIAGSARGRSLITLPTHSFVRPILARIKKSLFDILTPHLANARFLDLYAGIGTVGLEALSRGVASAVFVEQDPQCIRVIHDNLENLKLADKATVYRANVVIDLSFLPKPFDLIFVGAPYKDEGKNPLALVLPTLETIRKANLLSEKGFVIAQHHKKEKTNPKRPGKSFVKKFTGIPSSLFTDWPDNMKFLSALLAKWKSARPQASAAQTPVDMSFSRLQTYQRCPWMYHLVYGLGWRSGPNSGMAMGLSLHRTLAAYHDPSNPEKTIDRLWAFFDELWVNEGFQSTQETLDAYDNGRKILEQYFKLDQSRPTEVISTEKEYQAVLDGNIQFHWTLDRLDRHPDGTYEIVEYKSNPHRWNDARRENDLQMTLYALGMQKALGTDGLKLKYHFLSSNEQMAAHRSKEQIQTAEELIKNVAEKIRRGAFEPNTDHCVKCEFSNRCTKSKGKK